MVNIQYIAEDFTEAFKHAAANSVTFKLIASLSSVLFRLRLPMPGKQNGPENVFCEHTCSSVLVHTARVMHASLLNHTLGSRRASNQTREEREWNSGRDLACCDNAVD